ncbi:hypothetical protein PV10_00416 [Exophiala mesophila]|uniref:Amidase domain-containing protein n=1 Tax=Exophiala mesophila TaxID=212818 RepID=A0A0D2ACB6_EXOME|nr:uncharacterized protein PV10_00416 [Exophiala mesophila]KIV96568.1 hypothetical protein PV10_00416 [Exophiala mesophila]
MVNLDELSIVETSVADLLSALSSGEITSVELVAKYLHRIATYDWNGISLNSVPLLNPKVFDEAAASDERRASGQAARPLEGIPFTVKDNFGVAGMTAAAGSPAFVNLKPQNDAFVVERLRAAGAVLLGRTNMPPMAAGGMQRGVYGRAESPYNMDYLTAAFSSGSSNGCGTSTAASFAAFGLGSETVSSGRSPASNNGLVAYTPSRGLISCRGLWPLYATCDVVVPYARCMDDLFRILDVVVAVDSSVEGDFWRYQDAVKLPLICSVRPSPLQMQSPLQGKRIGVPSMFIAADDQGPKAHRLRPSIAALWKQAKSDLETLGACVVATGFPALTNYEGNTSADMPTNVDGCPPEWFSIERKELLALTWERFLHWADDPNFPTLGSVDGHLIFPKPNGYVPDRFMDPRMHLPYPEIVRMVQEGRLEELVSDVTMKKALIALEAQRKRDFEDWMDQQGLDLVVFPANSDVGRADLETDEESARHALGSGVRFSHGNRIIRHLGIPSISICMGVMDDTQMPVNLTFIGKAYQDQQLLAYAHAYEAYSRRRSAPTLTPPLSSDSLHVDKAAAGPSGPNVTSTGHGGRLKVTAVERCEGENGGVALHIAGAIQPALQRCTIEIYIDGNRVDEGDLWADSEGSWQTIIPSLPTRTQASCSEGPYNNPTSQQMVVVIAMPEGARPCAGLVLLDRD